MLESYLINAEKKDSFFRVFLVSFLATIIIGSFAAYLKFNSLLIITFVTLFFVYPVVNYIRSLDKYELTRKMNSKSLVRRHEEEIFVLSSVFLGTVIAFYLLFSFYPGIDTISQQSILNGKITDFTQTFTSILKNNLIVGAVTFVFSFLTFSSLMFILVWNASVLAYFLSSFPTHKTAFLTGLLLFSHGFLEIGGYILSGVAGGFLAYRIDRKKKLNDAFKIQFRKDILMIVLMSIVFIVLGALFESL